MENRSRPPRPHMIMVRLSDDELVLLDKLVDIAQGAADLTDEWDRSSMLRFGIKCIADRVDEIKVMVESGKMSQFLEAVS